MQDHRMWHTLYKSRAAENLTHQDSQNYAMILMLYLLHAYDIKMKWDKLMSPPTLKIMDEKFIALS